MLKYAAALFLAAICLMAQPRQAPSRGSRFDPVVVGFDSADVRISLFQSQPAGSDQPPYYGLWISLLPKERYYADLADSYRITGTQMLEDGRTVEFSATFDRDPNKREWISKVAVPTTAAKPLYVIMVKLKTFHYDSEQEAWLR